MGPDPYLIIQIGADAHVWPLGTERVDEQEALVQAARVALGIAPEVTGLPDSGATIAITFGEPHHTLMARATLGTADDLLKVDRARVAAHAAARADIARRVHIDAVRAAYALLDEQGKAEVRGATAAPVSGEGASDGPLV